MARVKRKKPAAKRKKTMKASRPTVPAHLQSQDPSEPIAPQVLANQQTAVVTIGPLSPDPLSLGSVASLSVSSSIAPKQSTTLASSENNSSTSSGEMTKSVTPAKTTSSPKKSSPSKKPFARRRVAPQTAEPIGITDIEIKTAFAEQLIAQRNAYLGYLTYEDGEGLRADLGAQQWLDAEHVDGILRMLISKQERLRNTVGIYPVFNLDQLYYHAQTLIYEKIIRDPRYQTMRPDNTPLPELTGLTGEELAVTRESNQREQKRRCQQELLIRQEADRILERNGISKRNMFPYYLECVVNNNQLLGNPAKQDLEFKVCEQLVIPLLRGKHYTVIVVDCYMDEHYHRKADIKFYDSKGHELEPVLREQVVGFFRKDWPNAAYFSLSSYDQPDVIDCGLWAAFKAYDIVNANYRETNVYEPSPLLTSNMTELRTLSHVLLRELGFAITDGASAQAGAQPNTSITDGIKELLVDCIERFVTITMHPMPTLENLDLLQMWQLCETEFKRADELLKALKKKDDKNEVDNQQFQDLQKVLTAFATIASDLKITAQEERKKRKAPGMWDQFVESFRGIPWVRAVILTLLLSAGSYFGGPYLLEAAIAAGTFLPLNPVSTIFAAIFIFLMSFQMVNWIADLVGASTEENHPQPQPPITQIQNTTQQATPSPDQSPESRQPDVEAILRSGDSSSPILNQSVQSTLAVAPLQVQPLLPAEPVINVDEQGENRAGVRLTDDLVVVGDSSLRPKQIIRV